MTTLSENKPRVFEIGEINALPVIADDIIFQGAAVGDNGSGIARPLEAGDPFLGFAVDKCDNAGGAESAKRVQVRQAGLVQLAVASAAAGDVGASVYASDDDTFVKTATSNTYIGRIARFVSSGVAIVEFDARRGLSGSITSLTDNSTGTSGGATIAAVSDVGSAADAIATIAAKVNELCAAQK